MSISKNYPSKEWELINSISNNCSTKISTNKYEKEIGDDCAVRNISNKKQLISGDTLVEGVHFSLDFMTIEEVGFKAIASNISDIAAMGGIPDGLILQVVFPKDSDENIKKLYKGINRAVNLWSTPVVGGDLSAGPCWVIAVTVLGEAGKHVLYRSGAKVGDKVWITKCNGKSSVGLDLLFKYGREKTEEMANSFLKAHISPTPSIEIAVELSNSNLVTSAIDTSDGIAKELLTIGKESGVGFRIFMPDMVKKELGLGTKLLHRDEEYYFLNGGEDYGLLFTADKSVVADEFSFDVINIGEVTDILGKVIYANNLGEEVDILSGGWDHL